MKRLVALSLSGVLVCASTGWGGDHVVTPAAVKAALAGAEFERSANVDSIRGVLDSHAAKQVAERFGVDLKRVRDVVPTLSDDEIRDLAGRAASLNADPAAGAEVWVYMLAGAGALLILLLIWGLASD